MLTRGLDVSRPGEADDSFASLQVRKKFNFLLGVDMEMVSLDWNI